MNEMSKCSCGAQISPLGMSAHRKGGYHRCGMWNQNHPLPTGWLEIFWNTLSLIPQHCRRVEHRTNRAGACQSRYYISPHTANVVLPCERKRREKARQKKRKEARQFQRQYQRILEYWRVPEHLWVDRSLSSPHGEIVLSPEGLPQQAVRISGGLRMGDYVVRDDQGWFTVWNSGSLQIALNGLIPPARRGSTSPHWLRQGDIYLHPMIEEPTGQAVAFHESISIRRTRHVVVNSDRVWVDATGRVCAVEGGTLTAPDHSALKLPRGIYGIYQADRGGD